MAKLKLHDASIPREQIQREREQHYLSLSPVEKFNTLLNLIKTAVKLNGGKRLKQPQGKGIIISKLKK